MELAATAKKEKMILYVRSNLQQVGLDMDEEKSLYINNVVENVKERFDDIITQILLFVLIN